MDLLDRLLGHDAWTTRELLLRCHGLSDDQLDKDLALGHGSVRATLHHIIFNMEVWADLIAGRITSPADVRRDGEQTVAALGERLDRAAAGLARVARSVSDRRGWDETWLDVLDTPPATKTFGAAIAHVVTHSMHHRAQVLFMLRRLGVRDLPEGDVFSWERQSGSAS
jgi:uncharacterized damage-inducible protein DinB